MKFYVSAKWDQKDLVAQVQDMLRERGHSITEDWTKHDCVKPYDKETQVSRAFAKADIGGVLASNVFLHLSDGGGKGKYTELGAAIAGHCILTQPQRLYVFGREANESQFYLYPTVIRVQTTDVLDAVKTLVDTDPFLKSTKPFHL
jgi:hypothetical protein